jgi:glycosyltransferase involved in cell wall biosynthesis
VLIRAGDADGLASAVVVLAQDADLRRRLGESARAYALDAYRADRLLNEISELYQSLVGLTC